MDRYVMDAESVIALLDVLNDGGGDTWVGGGWGSTRCWRSRPGSTPSVTYSRTNERYGSRLRTLATQAGDVQLRIPELRKRSFFPLILEPRRRIDQALYAWLWRPTSPVSRPGRWTTWPPPSLQILAGRCLRVTHHAEGEPAA